MNAKGTTTLKLEISYERGVERYGPILSATKPGRIRPIAEEPLIMERR